MPKEELRYKGKVKIGNNEFSMECGVKIIPNDSTNKPRLIKNFTEMKRLGLGPYSETPIFTTIKATIVFEENSTAYKACNEEIENCSGVVTLDRTSIDIPIAVGREKLTLRQETWSYDREGKKISFDLL